ncbi:uncharacterized protein ARMOST_06093 [Armillaria ostoyae]|uniref:F-box domain-containing protein n=1 Tax=Armillaria ostoyae TaxID=47428 RepID=A0A284R207_ARMOS|nr:uncharacterized protein ARMOST_06093 [Armillaria ostoyae]
MASPDVDYQQLKAGAMWVLRTDRLGTFRVVVPFETYTLPLVLMARVLFELHELPVNIPHLPKERALHPQSFRAPSLLPVRKYVSFNPLPVHVPIRRPPSPFGVFDQRNNQVDEVDRTTYHAGLIRSLVQYVSRSLTELTLTTVDFTSTDALSILRMMPNIVRLSIVEQNKVQRGLITSDFIEGLVDRRMLPNLRHLQLVWSGDVDEAAVMDMVENRAVKSIVIGVRMGGELRQNTLSRVDALRKRGTSITLW